MKTNLIIFVLFCCLFSFCSFYSPIKALAQDQQNSIKFRSITLEEAMVQSQDEDKIIFIDAYTESCGPCKWMEKNVYTDKLVAEFYNSNFICLKIDMNTDVGTMVARNYYAQILPTFLFLHKDGKLKFRGNATMNSKVFLEFGKKALLPEVDIPILNEKYNKGNREENFLLLYLDVLNSANVQNRDVANVFLEKQNDLFSETSWMVIEKYVWDKNSKYYKFLIENIEKFKAIYGEVVKNKINKGENKFKKF